tara:strand:+ start:4485 stop:5519 length:1035 start_codon:yes stop_codon:yes gene_type:complete
MSEDNKKATHNLNTFSTMSEDNGKPSDKTTNPFHIDLTTAKKITDRFHGKFIGPIHEKIQNCLPKVFKDLELSFFCKDNTQGDIQDDIQDDIKVEHIKKLGDFKDKNLGVYFAFLPNYPDNQPSIIGARFPKDKINSTSSFNLTIRNKKTSESSTIFLGTLKDMNRTEDFEDELKKHIAFSKENKGKPGHMTGSIPTMGRFKVRDWLTAVIPPKGMLKLFDTIVKPILLSKINKVTFSYYRENYTKMYKYIYRIFGIEIDQSFQEKLLAGWLQSKMSPEEFQEWFPWFINNAQEIQKNLDDQYIQKIQKKANKREWNNHFTKGTIPKMEDMKRVPGYKYPKVSY